MDSHNIPVGHSLLSHEGYDVRDSLPMLMSTCVKHMRQTLNKSFTQLGYGLTSEQWVILTHLADKDGVTQQDIATRYGRTEVSVLHLLKKLEQSGLVLRRRDPKDARSNRVYLTPEGRKLQKALIPVAHANISKMSAGLDHQDIEHLKTLLRKMTSNLKN